MSEDLNLLESIAQAIYDKKGANILALDVKGVSSITDYVVIAEGMVDRHVLALAQEIEHALKEQGERPLNVEGLQHGDWVVLDYGRFMVHLFMPGVRDRYRLEDLYREGKVVDLKIKV